MRVLLLVVLSVFAAAALIAAAVGPEVPLAVQPIVPRALGQPLNIAGSPHGFFAAWFEGGRLLGARLSPDGELLDENPFVFSPATPGAHIRVEWNGSEYVVAWVPVFSDAAPRVWFVAPEGSVRGPGGSPEVRNARNEWLMMEWNDASRSATFFAVGSDDSRTPLGSMRSDHRPVVQLAVAAGDDWGVLAQETLRVRWYSVRRDGSVTSYVFDPGFVHTRIVSVAARENEVAFSWIKESPGIEVGYQVIDSRTGALRHSETLARYSVAPDRLMEPIVAFDGAELIVAWAENQELRVRRGNSTRTIATYGASEEVPGIAFASGPRKFLLWTVRGLASSCCARTYIRPFDHFDDDRPAAPLKLGPAPQLEPRAVSGPGGVFTVWREESPTPRLMSRLQPAGAVTVVGELGEFSSHAVTANADTYTVVWSEHISGFPAQLRILMRRYDHAGVALDAEPVSIANERGLNLPNTAVLVPRIAAIGDGASFVVAWLGPASNLYAARVPSRGAVSPVSPVRLSAETMPMTGPVFVRFGGRIFVIHDFLMLNGFGKRIQALRLADDLSVETRDTLWDITRFQVTIYPVVYDRNPFHAAAVNDELLIAWSERDRPGSSVYCLQTRRFTTHLLPLEPPRPVACGAVTNHPSETYVPSVAHDGKSWWVAAKVVAPNEPLSAWRLTSGGTPEPPLTIVAGEAEPSTPTLVPTPSGVLVLYSRSERIFARAIATNPRGRAVRR